jgi:hypothetical protein
MKILLLLILNFPFAFGISIAASADSIPLIHHSIGISGSSITGPGISYRYNSDNQYYIKTVGFLYYSENSDLGSDLNGFIGLEFQRNLIQRRNSRLYGFIGMSYWYGKSKYSFTDTVTTINTDLTANLGGGLGFELSVWEHFAVNVDFGFQYARISYTTTEKTNYYLPHSRFGMGGGLGFSYQF